MGKRSNIRATRAATEVSARELSRQTELAERAEASRRAGLTEQQRATEDAATAEQAEGKVWNTRDGLLILGGIVGTIVSLTEFGAVVTLILWALVLLYAAYRRKQRDEAAAREAEAAAAAERARRDEEQARRAQVEHHVRLLCQVDPVFVRLVNEWNRIPPTRAEDRRHNEARQAERMVIIDQYAADFAARERTGQPVPDHATAMRELVAAEQAWDERRALEQ